MLSGLYNPLLLFHSHSEVNHFGSKHQASVPSIAALYHTTYILEIKSQVLFLFQVFVNICKGIRRLALKEGDRLYIQPQRSDIFMSFIWKTLHCLTWNSLTCINDISLHVLWIYRPRTGELLSIFVCQNLGFFFNSFQDTFHITGDKQRQNQCAWVFYSVIKFL